ncbi:antitoxin AF2212-like protein [Desulfonatronospira sp.]|uniref:antitoxin AF2212-like protein n=1 Tax=Desulfonatronospira sp. TaxID=1962951 RepID=UPI0025C2A462|nr:antitoxin AF2212-like protein [Desulfonatronospira sp.]
MQTIKVKYHDGVFVPMEPVNIGPDYEAVVVVSHTEAPDREKSAEYYQGEAKRYFEKHFPDLKASEKILELVGALQGQAGTLDKAEYHEYLGRKYR